MCCSFHPILLRVVFCFNKAPGQLIRDGRQVRRFASSAMYVRQVTGKQVICTCRKLNARFFGATIGIFTAYLPTWYARYFKSFHNFQRQNCNRDASSHPLFFRQTEALFVSAQTSNLFRPSMGSIVRPSIGGRVSYLAESGSVQGGCVCLACTSYNVRNMEKKMKKRTCTNLIIQHPCIPSIPRRVSCWHTLFYSNPTNY